MHQFAGYAALALVLLRIVHGFFGRGHARFDSFVPGPSRLIAYLGALLSRREPRTLGHNPLGAMMVLLLLGSTVALGLTGWMLTRSTWRDARWV